MSKRYAVLALGLAAGLGWGGTALADPACQTADNLVANCGFEVPTVAATVIPNWTPSSFNVLLTTSSPITDVQSAFITPNAADPPAPPVAETLSQTLALVGATSYRVQFNLRFDAGDALDQLTASLGGNQIFDQLDPSFGFPSAPGGGVYHFDQVVITDALPANFDILFSAVSPDGQGNWLVDDVSVAPATTPTPEPTSLALLGIGLASLPLLRRRSRRS